MVELRGKLLCIHCGKEGEYHVVDDITPTYHMFHRRFTCVHCCFEEITSKHVRLGIENNKQT